MSCSPTLTEGSDSITPLDRVAKAAPAECVLQAELLHSRLLKDLDRLAEHGQQPELPIPL
jgi:hypothetical protein